MEKLEGRVANKIDKNELREVREGLLVQLQNLEDKIKIEPKPKEPEPKVLVPPLSVRGN